MLTRVVQPIQPAVIDARSHDAKEGGDLHDHAVHMNVRHVAKQLRETTEPLFRGPLDSAS